jgi:hypothetical protein
MSNTKNDYGQEESTNSELNIANDASELDKRKILAPLAADSLP